MANTVTFGMVWQVWDRQSIDLPDDIDPNDEEAVKAYIRSVWDDILLPGEGNYVEGSDELDEAGPLEIHIESELTTLDKSACQRMFDVDAKSGARKLCGAGECICDYECGHPNRKNGPFQHTPLQTGTKVCPLAKYGVKPEENPKPWWERHVSELEPTDDELFALCALCDNADVVMDDKYITANRKDLHACFGCPVKMAEDAIQEARAEGACS